MSKIFKLFINENIKSWKKISTKILLIVILLALIGTLGLVKIIENVNQNFDEMNGIQFDWKESYKKDLENLREELKNEATDEQTQNTIKAQIETHELALKYDITPYKQYWKNDVLNNILELIIENGKESEITKLKEILEIDDYSKYIEEQKQTKKIALENDEITKNEYDDEIKVLELKDKYEIGKNQDEEYWKIAIIQQIQTIQRSLRTGIDFSNSKALTVEKKQEYEDTIKMYTYRLEHNISPMEYTTGNYRMIFESLAPGFVVAVLAIAAIIIAGGEISTESSTGTIKFWALTPNKRWKILTAKILSVLFYIIVATLIVSLLTVACANIFFKDVGTEYLYVKDGQVRAIGNALYIVEMYFAKIIPVIIFALFAIMLSTITRNTAVAVSFSVATYMGNGIAMGIINQFIKKDWVRFVPFNNLNIADKIFANTQNPMAMFGETFATSTSLQFSLAVLGVCAILMLVTMYDSFNHKDII